MSQTRLSLLRVSFGILLASVSAPSEALAQQTKCVDVNTAPIHEKMAALDANSPCPPVVTINRWRTLLDRITPRCKAETRTGVADGIVTARRLLFERGVEVGYLEIAEYLDRVTTGQTGVVCDRMLGAYVVRRSSG